MARKGNVSTTNTTRPVRRGGVAPVLFFTAKCTHDNETRLVHLSRTESYADLLDSVKIKFPAIGHFSLKYVNGEGAEKLITSRTDVSEAIKEVLAAYEQNAASGMHGSRLPPQIPPIKIVVTSVENESDVPVPPDEEIQLLTKKKILAETRARVARAREKGDTPGPDDWLVDFANLFRESLGIDPDRHVDMHNLGVEKCQKAIESDIACDQALPIFDEAAEKFKEVTCVGLLNWGNVFVCLGHRFASESAVQGKKASEVEGEILGLFDKAEERFQQAMGYKSDFYDGVLALAQLEFERAKIKIGLLIEPPFQEPSSENQDAPEAMNEAMKKALGRIDGSKVPQVQGMVDKSWAMYKDAVELGEKLDKEREKEKDKDKDKDKKETQQAGGVGSGDEEEPGLKTHALVMWGNVMFEQSQILAVTSGEWKAMLDEAVAKFRAAGCNEKDITQALRTHLKADELDLPKEEEPKPVKEVKGLPPLDSKPRKTID